MDKLDSQEQKLRNQIFALIKKIHAHRQSRKDPFIPGESPIPYAGRIYDEEEICSLVDCALDFWLTEGRFAAQFEKDFSRYLDVPHTILTNSGSSANLLAISALTSPKLGDKRIFPKDEIISTAAAFPTTVNPIIQVGAKPVFVDVDLGTYNPSVDSIQDAITPKTKAIFLAHTLGNPFDAVAIKEIAEDKHLYLIEDCCDALGSTINNAKVGSFGDIGTFSFYPAHHITMGEGGALVTQDENLSRIIRSFRDWGRDCWCRPGVDNTCGKRFSWQFGDLPFGYDHKCVSSHIGFNLKVVDMQPAIGVIQLKKLEGFINARRENFQKYFDFFKKWEKYFILPQWLPNSNPSWFGFILTVKENAPFSRNEFVQALESKKIATRPLFLGNLVKHPAYEGIDFRIHHPLKNADIIMNQTFWIGVYSGITPEMNDFVRKKASDFIESRKSN